MSVLNEQKYNLLNKLISEKEELLIHINSQNKEIQAPDFLFENLSFTLKIGLFFAKEIKIDPLKGFSQELNFAGKFYPCQIPFEAIWGVSDEKLTEGFVWNESAPSKYLSALLNTSLKKKIPLPEDPNSNLKLLKKISVGVEIGKEIQSTNSKVKKLNSLKIAKTREEIDKEGFNNKKKPPKSSTIKKDSSHLKLIK